MTSGKVNQQILKIDYSVQSIVNSPRLIMFKVNKNNQSFFYPF